MAESPETRNIVRIAGFDLDGTRPLWYALTGVKGVGINFARAAAKIIAQKFGKSINDPLGVFPSDADSFIEDVLKNPLKYGIPSWMVNDPKDYRTGEDKHLVGTDLETYLMTRKKHLFEIKTWRGIRLVRGLRVRGQRTKAHPRKNKVSVVGRKRR